MENLNKLLNTALKTQNQNYISPDGKKNCFKEFEKLSKNNSPAYFNYNEYNFAIDLSIALFNIYSLQK